MSVEKSETTYNDFFKNSVENPDKEMLDLGEMKDEIYKKIIKIEEQLAEFERRDHPMEVERISNEVEYAKIKLAEDVILNRDVLTGLDNTANKLINFFNNKLRDLD